MASGFEAMEDSVFKRVLSPSMLFVLTLALASPANAQITCSISSTGAAIGPVPVLPGVTANASDAGHTEVGAAGSTGVADVAGGGRVRVSCANAGAAPANPGVVVLIVTFGAPITNTQTHPNTPAGIRLINGTGNFVTPGALGPEGPNPGNVGIAAIENAAGRVVIGLGTPGATVGTDLVSPFVPAGGITFGASSTSTFELAGWLLSTNGKTGAINATLTSSGGIGVVSGAGNCTAGAGPCTQVITSVKPGVQDPTVPTGTLPALVTSLPNLGSTPIAGGPAVIGSNGAPIKTNFSIRIRENYADFFKSSTQFNTGGVFPASSASSVQVNLLFSGIPAGFDISGCSAVFTDVSGTAPALPGGPTVSTSTVTADSQRLTVLFSSPIDQANIDVLWITCTKVGVGTATLPLPSTPITAQIFAGPTGDALASGFPLTGLTSGMVPRYASAQSSGSSFGLVSIGGGSTGPSSQPALITAAAGSSQIGEVGGAFTPLRVTVRDRFDNLVSGATVTFTLNNTASAGATFPRGNTAVTDASGLATIEVRANYSVGSYAVVATSGNATAAFFYLNNTQRLTVAIPALQSQNANQLGIAWTNTLNKTVTVRATARGYDGQLLTGSGVQNPAEFTVPAGGQFARLASEVFGAGIVGRSGWVELTASDTGGNGFFLVFDNALTNSDGGAFPAAPSRRLVFPHVDRDTVLHVVNTGDQSNPATAVLAYNNSGVPVGGTVISLGPKAGWTGRITDLLPSLTAFDGYVVLDTQGDVFSSSSETLVGMQSYQRGDAAIVIGQRDSEVVTTGYAVHVAVGGGYTTRLKLVNPAAVSQQLVLTLNGANVQRTIPAFGRLDESLALMFNITGSGLTTGHLKLQASETLGVSGYVEISASEGLLRTTTPISNESQRRLVFSHIAQGGGYFTGLALLNADNAPATVTIEVNSSTGVRLASKTVTIQGGERLIGLLNELFPEIQNQMGGFVRVESTLPIHGLQIFGNRDFLTNIPGGTF